MPERFVPRAERVRREMREKVLQWLRDIWRPYHGSTAHKEDDGLQIANINDKQGDHMPLNAAVLNLAYPTKERDRKLRLARDVIAHELYRLACGEPEEVLAFSEIQDLFGRYGASDSDYDFLRDRATGVYASPRDCARLRAVDAGIDAITDHLIAIGVTGKDFWADFPHGRPSSQWKQTQEKKRQRYLSYVNHWNALRAEKKSDGSPRHKRVTNKALKMAAEECGVTKQTIITAVQEYESGYIMGAEERAS